MAEPYVQPQAYDAEGKPMALTPEALSSGAAGFKAGSRLYAKDPYGKLVTVDAGKPVTPGYEVLSPEALSKAYNEKEYGSGAGNMALAGGAGLARGATLGLSDPAIAAVGGSGARRALKGLREANPNLSTGSEMVGAVGAALATEALSGGAATPELGALAARGALTPMRAAAALGKLAEGAAPAGEGLLAAGARMGARGAAEGALYGAGNEVSRATLDDVPLTAERLLAGAWDGAKMGGAFGVGAGVVGKGLGKLGRRLLGKLEDEGAPSTLDAAPPPEPPVKPRLVDPREVLVRPSKEVLEAHEAAMQRVAGGVTPEEAEAVRRFSHGYDESLRGLQRGASESEIAAGNTRGAEHAAEAAESLPHLQSYMARMPVASEVPYVYRGLAVSPEDAQALLTSPTIYADPVAKAAATSASANPLVARSFVARNLEPGQVGVTLKLKHRSAVGTGEYAAERMRVEKELLLPGDAEFKVVNRFEDSSNPGNYIVEAEEIPPAAAPTTPAIEPAAAAPSTPKTSDLGSNLLMGILTGHPLTGVVAGAGIKAVRQLVQERGAAAMSSLADRLSSVQGRLDIAAKVAAGVESAKAIATPAAYNTAKLFKQYSGVLQQAKENPESFVHRMADVTESIAVDHPDVAQQIQSTMVADQAYLDGLHPQPASRLASSLTPQALPAERYSFDQQKTFVQAAVALDNPLGVFAEIAKGDLPLPAIAALKARRPALYADMRQAVVKYTLTRKTQLPFNRRMLLGVAFEFPADWSMLHTTEIQASLADSQQKPPAPQPPPMQQPTNQIAPGKF